VSGDVFLSDEGGVATRLFHALATLTDQVKPNTFALIGGLAVITRLQGVHRATDDIDGVSQQFGDEPSDVAIVLGETGRSGVRRLIDGVKIDHIDVGETPATEISPSNLPDDEWDRAFVLAHRWGLDAASSVTITAVENRIPLSTVTCLAASSASLVAMKLQSAPRRSKAAVGKAANDYLDLHRLLSNAEVAPRVATDLQAHAPHDLGHWAIARIGHHFIERADDTSRAIRHSGTEPHVSAEEVEATGMAFMARVSGPGESYGLTRPPA
jgi:hypothetical protein